MLLLNNTLILFSYFFADLIVGSVILAFSEFKSVWISIDPVTVTMYAVYIFLSKDRIEGIDLKILVYTNRIPKILIHIFIYIGKSF